MSLRFKNGVDVRGIRSELLLAILVASDVYAEHNADCVVTSLLDGKHSSNSRHYDGAAMDLRTNDLATGRDKSILDEIRARLLPLGDYDVIFENADTPNEHIHIEYEPKWRS